MVRLAVVGNVPPQTTAILQVVAEYGYEFDYRTDHDGLGDLADFDLVIVAGYRRLIRACHLDVPRYGTVGFHSAKLPEYPGRAPVPWALIRGDDFTYNTMFYLDEGVDSGDIIDQRRIRIYPGDNPDALYYAMARTGAEMLRQHLPALLDGTAPRTPQDKSKRGPLTTADGWRLWESTRHGLVNDARR